MLAFRILSLRCLWLAPAVVLASVPWSSVTAQPPFERGAQDVRITNEPETPVPIEVTSPVTLAPALEGAARFLGVSTTLHRGDAGVVEQNASCASEFPGSAVCTTEQVLSARSEVCTAPEVWVRPVLAAVGTALVTRDGLIDPDASIQLPRPIVLDEPSGMTNVRGVAVFSGSLSCSHIFQQGTNSGMVMSCSGRPSLRDCNARLPVACCGAPPASQP